MRLLRALARIRPRHAPYAPLALTIILTDVLMRIPPLRRRQVAPPAPLAWGRGVSVVIPERGGAAMLGACLDRLAAATAGLDEPAETVVVVNGSAPADYQALRDAHPAVRWLHFAAPLGFTRAVLEGVAVARHGAVYLLNNDMLLEPDALRAALSWRGPRVFAVASQIFFQDAGRRREETGWTSVVIEQGLPVPRHETPVGDAVRGTVWAGAGSSLFHAGLLRRLLPDSVVFDPFYWEDVDLCVRAWREGYEALFCPASVAWHKHRVTVERYYAPAEVARIFERNRLLFQLRNPFPRQPPGSILGHVLRLDRRTLGELGSWRSCLPLWRARWQALRAPCRDTDYLTMWTRRHARPSRPALVLVSPFAVLPPLHGGAVRTQRLAVELAREFEVILLSDERDLYGAPDEAWYAPFAEVRLLRARPGEPAGRTAGRIARIRSHSRPELKEALARIVARHRPAAVLVEHMELAGLVAIRPAPRPAFILSLHDVLLSPDDPRAAAADRFEARLIDRFDGLVVCSPEDQALLGARPARLVRNGYDRALIDDYAPSAGSRRILFVGPFRAPNNWRGVRDFLEQVYPQLERAVAGVSLTILGGRDARVMAAAHPCFARPSIEVVDSVPDVRPLLRACAVTINPQTDLRGSSLKLIESLAAGRVCVTTRTGARGMLTAGFRGIVAVERVSDLTAPLVRLLNDEAHRLALEPPEREKLAPYSWEAAGRELRAYVRAVAGGAE